MKKQLRIAGATPDEIIAYCESVAPGAAQAALDAQSVIPHKKRQIAPYQGAALFAATTLALRGVEEPRILEIGTFLGYSASVMALAAPDATITTLNPKDHEAKEARRYLERFGGRVTVVEQTSGDFMVSQANSDNYQQYDMIFVDGDHARVWLDMGYWFWAKRGGLFLHHDYSPEWSARPCKPVYDCLNAICDHLQRGGDGFDVLVVDNEKVGLAGWYV